MDAGVGVITYGAVVTHLDEPLSAPELSLCVRGSQLDAISCELWRRARRRDPRCRARHSTASNACAGLSSACSAGALMAGASPARHLQSLPAAVHTATCPSLSPFLFPSVHTATVRHVVFTSPPKPLCSMQLCTSPFVK